MISAHQRTEYAEMAAKMMETTPAKVPAGLLRRIERVHELYSRSTAHMDVDIRTLLTAMVVEESGVVLWED